MKDLFKGKTDFDNVFKTIFFTLFVAISLFVGLLAFAISQFDDFSGFTGFVIVLSVAWLIVLLLLYLVRRKYLKRPDGKQAKSISITGVVLIGIYFMLLLIIMWLNIKRLYEARIHQFDYDFGLLIQQMDNARYIDSDSVRSRELAYYLLDSTEEWSRIILPQIKSEIQVPAFKKEIRTDTSSSISLTRSYYKADCNGYSPTYITFAFYNTYLPDLDITDIDDNFDRIGQTMYQAKLSPVYEKNSNTGYPIREMVFENKDSKTRVTCMLVYKNQTLYKVLVLTSGDCQFKPAVNHFLNSFRLLEQ